MKKSEVEIGGVYVAKIAGRIVQVQIDAVSRYGGWDGTNMQTNKKVRVQSPAVLRSALGQIAKPARGEVANDSKIRRKRDTAQTVEPQGQTADPQPKMAKKDKTEKPKRLSALDAAAKVLETAGEPISAKQIVEVALAKGLWKSLGGKTPHATLYSAIIRETAKRNGVNSL
jgi:hypothetical protein